MMVPQHPPAQVKYRNTCCWLLFVFWIAVLGSTAQAQYKPHQDLGPLFHDVQVQPVFPDSKTFTDAVPKKDPAQIAREYLQVKNNPGFSLKGFVLDNFTLPAEVASDFTSDPQAPVQEHITKLWPLLTRQPIPQQEGSLLPLPKPYVVPGGRFREIYYWDSYFTLLGLQASGQTELIQHIIDNFTHLIQTVGHIPNGNRSYYMSRSQPPFYALMLRVLAQEKGQQALVPYQPALQKEYAFWMAGLDSVSAEAPAYRRVVRMPDGSILNRYWDDDPAPRPEAYKEDVEVAEQSGRDPQEVYRHLRAAAESGWDFSSRWLADGQNLSTIQTTDLVPVDLNALLYHMELTLADMAQLTKNKAEEKKYRQKAKARQKAIKKYFWSEKDQFFYDYNFRQNTTTGVATLAAVTPLFFCIASQAQAKAVAQRVQADFLQQGGLQTTLSATGQQWDAPNGWAPLQYMAIQGLKAYGFNSLANTIAGRWIQQNVEVFKRTGKLTEKYNVLENGAEGGGGEYPNQDGFGWTNGVLLRLLQDQAAGK